MIITKETIQRVAIILTIVLLTPFILDANCAEQFDTCEKSAENVRDQIIDDCKWWQINCKQRAWTSFYAQLGVCGKQLRDCIEE